MTAAHRWWTVGIVVLLLVATPVLVRALPAGGRGRRPPVRCWHAPGLARRRVLGVRRDRRHRRAAGRRRAVQPRQPAGRDQPAAGLVARPGHLAGRLAAPDGRDRPRAPGEPDGALGLRVEAGHHVPDVPVRLPDATDLLPHELARHALAGATRRAGPAARPAGRRPRRPGSAADPPGRTGRRRQGRRLRRPRVGRPAARAGVRPRQQHPVADLALPGLLRRRARPPRCCRSTRRRTRGCASTTSWTSPLPRTGSPPGSPRRPWPASPRAGGPVRAARIGRGLRARPDGAARHPAVEPLRGPGARGPPAAAGVRGPGPGHPAGRAAPLRLLLGGAGAQRHLLAAGRDRDPPGPDRRGARAGRARCPR